MRNLSFKEESLMIAQEEYISFLNKILNVVLNSDGNRQEVYAILQDNLDKLDGNLAQILHSGITTRLGYANTEEAEDIALAVGNLSRWIQDFSMGNQSGNLEIAITGFKVVETVYTQEAFPEEWALTQGNLGNAYFHRIQGDKPRNIDKAIVHYLASLKIYTRNAYPSQWAKSNNHLGLAYVATNKSKKRNLEKAIECFSNALEVYSPQNSANNWASTQNDLGCAYNHRIVGEKAENLEMAIHCFSEASKVYTRNASPTEWAKNQNNLGTTYIYRIYGEKAENLEMAVYCLSEALKVRTSQELISDWTDTQINLGIAYLYRIRGKREENLEMAIHCFSGILEMSNHNNSSNKWAIAKHNLGTVYSERIKGEREENLEIAIRHYLDALEVRTLKESPEEWAMTQDSLGSAYRHRIQGDRSKNLETAIDYYLNALKINTREAFPEEWARTQNNVGNTFLERIQGRKEENLEMAIRHFSNSLEVYTCEGFPQTHITIQFNLGLAFQSAQQFYNAKTAFASAIETLESQRSGIISGSGIEEDKQKLAEQWNQIYEEIVKSCLELDEITQALEYVERSKARSLIERMLSSNSHGIFPSEISNQLQTIRHKIANVRSQLQTSIHENLPALEKQVQQLRNQHDDLQNSYLQASSDFKLEKFQETLDDDSVILEWYFTTGNFQLFIISRQNPQPIVLSYNAFDQKELEKWATTYLRLYYRKNSKWWQNQLSSRLQKLSQILRLDDILTHIPKDCSHLILIPNRFLHIFPFHALPTQEKSYLLDHFSRGVSYAPSCQLLKIAKSQKRPAFNNLLAIQNPTQDLTYADLEVLSIQKYFDSASILSNTDATKAHIDTIPVNKYHCVHFSCHGYFNTHPNEANKSALILANAHINSTSTQFDPERHLLLADKTVLDLSKCLTLDAIFSPQFRLEQCRLVVLSACETGLVDFQSRSDEYIGLVSGFIVAGSPSIVSSLWAVDQVSTAFLFIKFYEVLKSYSRINEGDVAVALQNSQNWLRNLTIEEGIDFLESIHPQIERLFPGKPRSAKAFNIGAFKRITEFGNHPFAHPFYWAAFIATGI
jgi:CHAT domain-containing protein/tetratricopeptide (TPR) repeat protein